MYKMASFNPVGKQLLLPHLFFFRHLLTEQSPDIPHHESYLLSLISDFLTERSNEQLLKSLECASKAFERWTQIQSADSIDPVLLCQKISELRDGNYLPLFVRAQNAGLLLSLVCERNSVESRSSVKCRSESSEVTLTSADDCKSAVMAAAASASLKSEDLTRQHLYAVLSTFPESLPNKEVLTAPGELTCVYPATSVRIERSQLLCSLEFAKQLAVLHRTRFSAASASSFKNGVECDEVLLVYVYDLNLLYCLDE